MWRTRRASDQVGDRRIFPGQRLASASALHNYLASIFTAPSVTTWSDMSGNTRKNQVTRLVTLRHRSTMSGALITVCMNRRVYDECLRCVTFPVGPRVWSVADIGEPGRIADVESKMLLYREEAYQEIVRNVERLVLDVLGVKPHLTPIAYKTGTHSFRQIRTLIGQRLYAYTQDC